MSMQIQICCQLVGCFRLMFTILNVFLIQNSYLNLGRFFLSTERMYFNRHNSMTYWTNCIFVPHSHVFVYAKLNTVYSPVVCSLTKVNPTNHTPKKTYLSPYELLIWAALLTCLCHSHSGMLAELGRDYETVWLRLAREDHVLTGTKGRAISVAGGHEDTLLQSACGCGNWSNHCSILFSVHMD